MTRSLLSCCAAVSLAFALVATPAFAPAVFAQDGSDDPSAQPRDDGSDEDGSDEQDVDSDALLARVESVYAILSDPPVPVDESKYVENSREWREAHTATSNKRKRWEAALAEFPAICARYLEAAPRAERQSHVRVYLAEMLSTRAARVNVAESVELRRDAVESLRRYFEEAPEDDPYRWDAHAQLTFELLIVEKEDPRMLDRVREHAVPAIQGYLADGRTSDAGRLAFLVLKTQITSGREADAATLSDELKLVERDLGPSTENVRRLIRRSGVREGELLPKVRAVQAVGGDPLDIDALQGKPVLLHFFSTVASASTREIETIFAPLHEKWGAKGLQVIGVSLDREMSDEELKRKQKFDEENGTNLAQHDGRLTSVREFAEKQGLDWPWYWDGQFTKNVIGDDLGIDVSAPFAILIDAEGIVRWRGEPFRGVAEAVDALMAR